MHADRVPASAGYDAQFAGSVLLYESLQGQIVVVATIHCGYEFPAHAVGVGAAHVIAFEEDLVASADAHHAMAEIVDAGRFVARAEQGEEGECQED